LVRTALIVQFLHRAYTHDHQNLRDTVSSVGVIWSRALPFSYSNNAIKTFRQALALDEVGGLVF
jgi:uncharacterized protein (DUF2235 family)